MNLQICFYLAVVPLFLASSAAAQHETFNVNPPTSQVNITLGASDHATKGTFQVEKGQVEFDPKASTISGVVVVAAETGKTGNSSRDKKMETEVLDAAQFSDISFAPKSYQGTIAAQGDSSIQVTGIFTLHGTPHEITIPMTIHIDGSACTAKTTFSVPYVKWGLKNPSMFILKVAKEVQVGLWLTGSIAQ